MKILAVYPYIPYPLNRGAYYRAFYLLRALASEHEVDLFALAENGEGLEHQRVFEEFCNKVTVVPFEHPAWEKLLPNRLLNPLPSTIAHWTVPAIGDEIDRAIAREKYDALHLCDIVLGQYFLKKHQQIPVVADRTRVDLQYQLMEHKRMRFTFKNRLLNYENYLKLWRYEKAIARRSALHVVCGPDDETFTRKYISKRVPIEVIPNGVDLNYFSPENAKESRDVNPTLIFCGAMDYNPNIDALRWYFEEIHERLREQVPDLKLLIVGKDPVPEVKNYVQKPGVVVTGAVPDVRPYYKRAWMQMVPLRIGGGTRLKIVESIGMRTPVVSTTIGAQGLDLVHDCDILLADTAKDFIEQTSRALNDSDLRLRLEENGLRAAAQRLSWTKLGQYLCGAYKKYFCSQQTSRSALPARPEAQLV
jgi:sugar transferase (PEP-CTERM/EpsH1 system associated)